MGSHRAAFSEATATLVRQNYNAVVLFLGDRLLGLVVKASASRAADPRFDSRLRRGDFARVESYTSDL